jgi:predicted dehydrogenase
MSRRLRMGMVGGGLGSFIGPVHRAAARLGNRIELVAGAFSATPQKVRDAAAAMQIAPDRAYESYQQMFSAERGRADPIDFVTIVTPTALHFPIARMALESGLHVFSDKPATATLEEARALRRCVEKSNLHYRLSYTYTGYPMVRHARDLCRGGSLGAIRKIVVEYNSGWVDMAFKRLGLDVNPMNWRFDPSLAAMGGAFADIGVHAFNILEFVSGLRVQTVSAQLNGEKLGNSLFDDGNVLLKLSGDVPGVLMASGLATGNRNDLRLRVFAERAGLLWSHNRPDELTVGWRDGRTETLHAGTDYLSGTAVKSSRLPVGHPEGYIEAFANLYEDFADLIANATSAEHCLVPGIDEGARGMSFVAAAIASWRAASAWTTLVD